MDRKTTGQATTAAHKGATIINDTDEHSISASMISFSADAVIANLETGGQAVDVKSSYISTPANAVGDYWSITGISGVSFTKIQLSAGTANIVI